MSELSSGTPKYPNVEVVLPEGDFGTFYIIGLIAQALRRGRVSESEVLEFCEQASSDDLNHVIQVALRWVDVS